MLDWEMKSHGDNPSPGHYDVVVDMASEQRTNSLTQKKPRQTITDEILHRARRNKVPGVGAYETVAKLTEKGPILGKISNISRVTHIDEIINHGASMPPEKKI